jgi:hypothetical protein
LALSLFFLAAALDGLPNGWIFFQLMVFSSLVCLIWVLLKNSRFDRFTKYAGVGWLAALTILVNLAMVNRLPIPMEIDVNTMDYLSLFIGVPYGTVSFFTIYDFKH